MSSQEVNMYHYTNPLAFREMEKGYWRDKNEVGLRPMRALLSGYLWPDEAHVKCIHALLEPKPESWIHNSEFPGLWRYLLHDIKAYEGDILLLSCNLTPQDDAYVIDRGIIENLLYKEAKTGVTPTPKDYEKAFKKYWKSRIPAFEYNGEYDVAQYAIFSIIDYERLHYVWTKPKEELWEEAKVLREKQLDEMDI